MWPFSASSPSPSSTAAARPTSNTSNEVPPSACPVDHTTRDEWLKANPDAAGSPTQAQRATRGTAGLSTNREISSIPRWLPSESAASSSSPNSVETDADVPPTACPARSAATTTPEIESASGSAAPTKEEKWVYPSPSSFYAALQRKNRPADARDMDIVVPIHNAVNERVWAQVLEWEKDALGVEKDDEVKSKLVSFIGRPKDVSPRARWKTLIGYTAPFDRHDWIIDRPSPSSPTSPSQRVRYVIDFYTGRGNSLLAAAGAEAGVGGGMPNLAFYIDCRPALDGWEGVRMRAERWWKGWFPSPRSSVQEPATRRA